jgi:hypothetical protein
VINVVHGIRDDDATVTSKPDEQTYLQRHGDDHVTSEVIIHMMILVPRSIEEVAGAQEIRFLEIANKLARLREHLDVFQNDGFKWLLSPAIPLLLAYETCN